MSINRLLKNDFIYVILLSVVYELILITKTESLFKVSLGFLIIGFLPGYVVLRDIYGDMNYFHLLLLSIPLSLAISTIIGMLISQVFTTYNQTNSQTLMVVTIIIVFSAIGIIRGLKLEAIEAGLLIGFVLVISLSITLSVVIRERNLQSNIAVLEFEGIDKDTLENLPIIIKKNAPYPLKVGVELNGDITLPVGLICSNNLLGIVIEKSDLKTNYLVNFIPDKVGRTTIECSLGNDSFIRRIKLQFNVVE